MAYRNLRSLFHDPSADDAAVYEQRISDSRTIRLASLIGGNPAFIFMAPEIYEAIIETLRLDKEILQLELSLPQRALTHYRNSCLIDEIVTTNEIEGVNSTRREIGQVLERLSSNDRRGRFLGIVQKYVLLQTRSEIPLRSCADIRALYDDLVLDEVEAEDPENIPDGEFFRTRITHVVDQTGIPIHDGLEPESVIVEEMNKALNFLNDAKVEPLVRIAAFHFLFGYIHPFYDGNGRTGRFISSYHIAKHYEPITGLSISYAIRQNIEKYYKAFRICEHPLNRGDLTPFVISFSEIIVAAMKNLRDSLVERRREYEAAIMRLKSAVPGKSLHLAETLATAALFTFDGIDSRGLEMEEGASRQTIYKRLKPLQDSGLVISEKIGRKTYFKLDLAKVE